MKGSFEYKGFSMSQHENVIVAFSNLLNKVKPKRILEIGTYDGGLTMALRDIIIDSQLDCHIRSYDIRENSKFENLRRHNIDVRISNVFDSGYIDLTDIGKDEISSFISEDGLTLVLCDGGNKIQEFRILSQYLKSGDYIMAHDYSESIEYWDSVMKNKIWNWCEITFADISDSCLRNNLESFMKDEFQSVAWTCWRKQ